MGSEQGVSVEQLRCAQAILALASGDPSRLQDRSGILYGGWHPWVENSLVSFFAVATSEALGEKEAAFLARLSVEDIARALVGVNNNVELSDHICTQLFEEKLYVNKSREFYGDMAHLVGVGLFLMRFEGSDPHFDITERALLAFSSTYVGLSLEDIGEEIEKTLSRLVGHG